MSRAIPILLALYCLALGTANAAPSPRYSYVAGAGDVPLSVVEFGEPGAPAVLFIHGLGQSHASFAYQWAALAGRFHVVAFDLRGHGNSGKPWQAESYTDSRLWAEDVARVIQATKLTRPVLVSWSYGTLIAANYLRFYGTDNNLGLVMIGALGGLVAIKPGDIAADPGVLAVMQKAGQLRSSPAIEDTLAASRLTAKLLTARVMPDEWVQNTVAIGALVPPFVRTALGSQMKDNSDLVSGVSMPVWLVAGSEDHGTPPALMRKLAAALPLGAKVTVYPGSGHSPFAEDPESFNRDLIEFLNTAQTRSHAPAR